MNLKWTDALALAEDADVVYWTGPVHVKNTGSNLEDIEITDVTAFELPKRDNS